MGLWEKLFGSRRQDHSDPSDLEHPNPDPDPVEVPPDPEDVTREAVELLRPHLLPACFVLAADEASDPLPATASKFGGEPYAEEGEAWPIDEYSGREMMFVGQVNSADVPLDRVLPGGLWVIFADREHMENCDLCCAKGPLTVRHYASPAKSRCVPLPRPSGEAPAAQRHLVFQPGTSLPDHQTVASIMYRKKYREIDECIRRAGFSKSHPLFEEVRKRLLGEPPYQHLLQIGGHPQWVQDAEPPNRGQLPHEGFLMQINSDSDLGLLWYDDGSIYVYGDRDTFEPDYAIFQCA